MVRSRFSLPDPVNQQRTRCVDEVALATVQKIIRRYKNSCDEQLADRQHVTPGFE